MRKLTILRRKTFVACLGKMRVYIEDPISYELVINNIPSRKLGTLKNGEQQAFEIPEQAVRILVIADTLSAGIGSEVYQLPEGSEDISLAGQNKFNPARGNAFCFDNNETEEARQNRKHGNKKGIGVLIVAAIVGAIVGARGTGALLGSSDDPKNFTVNDMTITLTEGFEQVSVDNFTAGFESGSVALIVLEESFSLLEGFGEYTLDEYGALVIQNAGLDQSLKYQGDLPYFEYEYHNEQNGNTYHYTSYVYKENDAFWLLQFVTSAKTHNHSDQSTEKIAEWAASVRFDEN